jgi:hypothetical protein
VTCREARGATGGSEDDASEQVSVVRWAYYGGWELCGEVVYAAAGCFSSAMVLLGACSEVGRRGEGVKWAAKVSPGTLSMFIL